MGSNVIVVGGGLSGLAASIYLARAGRTVTLFEKRRSLGGRAVTTLRHGFRFNIGAHTFYRGGAAASVCRELGIPIRGGVVPPRGVGLIGNELQRLPAPWWPILISPMLTAGGRAQLLRALLRIRRIDRHPPPPSATLGGWLDENVENERARSVLRALIRSVTFSDHCERESASFSLAQMRAAMKGAVYVDEGWQKIVDAMHSAAISSGVNFITSSRVIGVEHDGSVRAVVLGGLELDADRMDTQAIAFPLPGPDDEAGTRLKADQVVLAVDPQTAAELAGEAGSEWTGAEPVTAACLDVALRGLPRPKHAFAIGIDDPVYAAAHSSFAQLTPKGGALMQTVLHHRDRRPVDDILDGQRTRRDPRAESDEARLEAVLDLLQPGWRELIIHRRFLPSMTVSNALVTPGRTRPSVRTAVRGLYIAGDWVGETGLLTDAALASARDAARAILAG